MAKNTCKDCGARFEGEGAAEALEQHVDAFHPAGAPAPARTVDALATTTTRLVDHGPAVREIATAQGDLESRFVDLEERVKALEEGEHKTAAEREGATETPTFADVKARAVDLGLPVVGQSRAKLEAAIEAEEKRRAEEGTNP